MTRLDEYLQVPERYVVPETMQAVVLSGVGQGNLRLETVRVPDCGDEQLLARVDAAAACASDNKLIDQGSDHPFLYGWDVSKYPIIVGHEGAVTIVKVGRNLKGQYKVGQRFAIQPAVPSGPRHYRERYRDKAKDINKIAIGYTLPGLFAEYVLITEETTREGCLIPMASSSVPYFAAALAEPISCVVAAQERIAHTSKDPSIHGGLAKLGPKAGGVTLIIGDGPMGLMNADVAMAHHPRAIIVSGHHTRRIDRIEKALHAKGRRLGIRLVCTLSESLDEVLLKETDGQGADDVIVAAGNTQAYQEGIVSLARKGVVHLFGGVPFRERMIPLDTHRVHYDGISITGSSGSGPSDLAKALEMIGQGLVDPGNYVQKCGGLDAAVSLIQAVRGREIDGKGIIYPHARSPLFDVEWWGSEKERGFLTERLISS